MSSSRNANAPGAAGAAVEDSQAKIIKSIEDLKRMEEELYSQLEKSGANEDDIQKQQSIIQRIENVSSIRRDLLNSLTEKYIDVQDNVMSSRNDLVQQTAMVGIVQDELDKANANIDTINAEKNNKLRMVELNAYERERYRSYMEIMKIVCVCAAIILILVVLGRKKIIPSENLVFMTVGITFAIGAIMILIRYLDIRRRDNLYFGKYKFPFDPDKFKDSSDAKGDIKVAGAAGCFNENCCTAGQSFDNTLGKCVTSVVTNQESFTNPALLSVDSTKTVDLNNKNDISAHDPLSKDTFARV